MNSSSISFPLIPVYPSHPNRLKKELDLSSKSGIFTPLIVKKDGTLAQTNIFYIVFKQIEKIFARLLRFHSKDRTDPKLVELKVIQLLSDGEALFKTEEEIKKVKKLAEKIGLTPSTKNDHSQLQELVDKICNLALHSEQKETPANLVEKFFKKHEKVLTPFLEEIKIFAPHQLFSSSTARSDKEHARNADEERHNETAAQQDAQDNQDKRHSDSPLTAVHAAFSHKIPEINTADLLHIPDTPNQVVLSQTQEQPLVKTEPATKIFALSKLKGHGWETAKKVLKYAIPTIAVIGTACYLYSLDASNIADTVKDEAAKNTEETLKIVTESVSELVKQTESFGKIIVNHVQDLPSVGNATFKNPFENSMSDDWGNPFSLYSDFTSTASNASSYASKAYSWIPSNLNPAASPISAATALIGTAAVATLICLGICLKRKCSSTKEDASLKKDISNINTDDDSDDDAKLNPQNKVNILGGVGLKKAKTTGTDQNLSTSASFQNLTIEIPNNDEAITHVIENLNDYPINTIDGLFRTLLLENREQAASLAAACALHDFEKHKNIVASCYKSLFQFDSEENTVHATDFLNACLKIDPLKLPSLFGIILNAGTTDSGIDQKDREEKLLNVFHELADNNPKNACNFAKNCHKKANKLKKHGITELALNAVYQASWENMKIADIANDQICVDAIIQDIPAYPIEFINGLLIELCTTGINKAKELVIACMKIDVEKYKDAILFLYNYDLENKQLVIGKIIQAYEHPDPDHNTSLYNLFYRENLHKKKRASYTRTFLKFKNPNAVLKDIKDLIEYAEWDNEFPNTPPSAHIDSSAKLVEKYNAVNQKLEFKGPLGGELPDFQKKNLEKIDSLANDIDAQAKKMNDLLNVDLTGNKVLSKKNENIQSDQPVIPNRNSLDQLNHDLAGLEAFFINDNQLNDNPTKAPPPNIPNTQALDNETSDEANENKQEIISSLNLPNNTTDEPIKKMLIPAQSIAGEDNSNLRVTFNKFLEHNPELATHLALDCIEIAKDSKSNTPETVLDIISDAFSSLLPLNPECALKFITACINVKPLESMQFILGTALSTDVGATKSNKNNRQEKLKDVYNELRDQNNDYAEQFAKSCNEARTQIDGNEPGLFVVYRQYQIHTVERVESASGSKTNPTRKKTKTRKGKNQINGKKGKKAKKAKKLENDPML